MELVHGFTAATVHASSHVCCTLLSCVVKSALSVGKAAHFLRRIHCAVGDGCASWGTSWGAVSTSHAVATEIVGTGNPHRLLLAVHINRREECKGSYPAHFPLLLLLLPRSHSTVVSLEHRSAPLPRRASALPCRTAESLPRARTATTTGKFRRRSISPLGRSRVSAAIAIIVSFELLVQLLAAEWLRRG